MAFTDHSITAYIFPQDGASSGISDTDADWNNAAYLGGLAKAKTEDYAPEGLGISADHTNEQFSISSGLAFIEDGEDIDFRVFSDSEINRSGTWTEGYLVAVHTKAESGISFQTTTATNYIYLGFDRSSQNNVFVRVADSEADAPSKGFKIGEIDASADSKRETNRISGYNWNFIKKYSFNNVAEAVMEIPQHDYDELMLKFNDVTGTDDSGSNYTLEMQINGVSSGYRQRTTQGSNSGISSVWITEAPPSKLTMVGQVLMRGSWDDGNWSFDNRTPAFYKYFAFGGGNATMASSNYVNKINLSWEAGNLTGEFTVWGRNHI